MDVFEAISGFFEILMGGPKVWIACLVLILLMAGGYAVYSHVYAEEVCRDNAHEARQQCLYGGLGRFHTSKTRKAMCSEQYDEAVAACVPQD